MAISFFTLMQMYNLKNDTRVTMDSNHPSADNLRRKIQAQQTA